MKLMYDEEILYKVMTDQVLPNVFKEIYSIPNHLILAVIQKINNVSFNQNCIISINNEGLLFGFMSKLKVDKATDYHFFKFKDMQGIALKNGIFGMKIIIQFKSGTRYQLYASKKSNNNLPNQTENLGYIISVLAAKNLNDMSSKKYSGIKWENRKSSFAYVSTLILALLIPICFINRIKSTLLFTVIVVAVWIVHFILFSALATSSEKRKNKKFTEEYNKIIEKYNEAKDDYQLYCDLKNILNRPRTKDAKNAYYLSLSTAASNIGYFNESLDYLDMVEYLEGDILNKAVNQQREDIKTRRYNQNN